MRTGCVQGKRPISMDFMASMMRLGPIIFLGVLAATCIAVPLDSAVDSVCAFKNVTYARGQEVPDMAPCEICHCESPPEISCSMIKCQPNNGCKILQQTNKCCPVYKCECEHEGKTYNNGEKLENPLDPCHVCYCRGGEIMCTSVTCYYREDCDPQYVPGQCCPKYGHCPPLEAKSANASNGNHREMQPWLFTKPDSLPTVDDSRPKVPQTIKIVEILPTTQSPSEVSMVPRIITSDGLEHKAPALPVATATEASTNVSVDEAALPDTELASTALPSHTNFSEFNETDTNGITESSGYDAMSGGTFFGFDTSRNVTDEDESTEPSEFTTQSAFVNSGLSIPPVLRLKERLQYLKVGSRSEVTENDTTPIVRIDIHGSPENGSSQIASQIMLRPEDLKTVAEILINRTITPVKNEERAKNLTSQEIWAQKVIDRLSSNVLLPLQGIELYDNDTNATTVEPESTTGERELNDEPSSVIDESSEEISEEDEEDDVEDKTTTSTESSEEDEKEDSTYAQASSPRTAQRRVRVTDKKSAAAAPTPFDERDRFLVDSFFRKTLKVN